MLAIKFGIESGSQKILDIMEKKFTTQDVYNAIANCKKLGISTLTDQLMIGMPGETSDNDGQLGYCWMHHFKCHSARSCRTWAKGGPIKEDNKSTEWQDKNKGSEIFRKTYK